jgi:hypothetical protein
VLVELFFNSLWLALAAAAVLGLFRKHRAGSDRKALLLGLCALLCASALLFPAISITDDLHFDAFVVEDSSSKRLVNAIAHTAPLVALAWFGLLALSFLEVSRERSWRDVQVLFFSYKNPFLIRPPSVRAPPRNVLA